MGAKITARPPGKELRSLSLLSGGEKSMTALAFLFAIFLARPCPFYVLDEVEAGFGSEVRDIVDGVTKLERVHFDSKEAQQAATMRKMLVAMAKDLRVLVIKLADRTHNMRTIAAMPAWKQERTAQETLDIYAPLAHRLGMQEVKQQLEDPNATIIITTMIRLDKKHQKLTSLVRAKSSHIAVTSAMNSTIPRPTFAIVP